MTQTEAKAWAASMGFNIPLRPQRGDTIIYRQKRVSASYHAVLKIDPIREVVSAALIPKYWQWMPSEELKPQWFGKTSLLEESAVEELVEDAFERHKQAEINRIIENVDQL